MLKSTYSKKCIVKFGLCQIFSSVMMDGSLNPDQKKKQDMRAD